MYTGNSINPSINRVHGNGATNQLPAGFAIIQIRTPEPKKVASPIIQKDILKIIETLEASKSADKPASNNDETPSKPATEFMKSDTALAISSSLAGLGVGILITNALGLRKQPPAKPDIADTVLKMTPDLVKALTTGGAMLAGIIGVSKWLTKESPEHLKIRLEALKQ
jgi:hypothetical protein